MKATAVAARADAEYVLRGPVRRQDVKRLRLRDQPWRGPSRPAVERAAWHLRSVGLWTYEVREFCVRDWWEAS